MMKSEDAEIILTKEYHRDNFLSLVDSTLLPDFVKDSHDVFCKNKIFKNVMELGTSYACDITVYEVILTPEASKRRITTTQEMFRILRGQRVNNALVAFRNNDDKNYRISLLTSKYELEGEKIVKVISNPRRYSYNLGYGTQTKTAYQFLIKNGKVDSLSELIDRFSVEIVNKQFYNEIALRFTELVGGEKDSVKYKRQLKIPNTEDQNKYAEFAVRLIGRIVFCWFLKEKKSAAGISLMPNDILSISAIDKNKNYYNSILEPLFFELLNTDHLYRKGRFATDDLFKQIPYLNGGLFSPHDDDCYVYSNSTKQSCSVSIPDVWLKNFFEVLSQYNFTVDENTSYDVELSIDPEMLGRIFENLLAEINPETWKSAKKSTGSFYTPRDIVDYMVDSSIFEYLYKKTDIAEYKLKSIIKYCDTSVGSANITTDERKKIIDALYALTILDPACGSGAFPIGMLQKIVYILQEIDSDAKLWFNKATENVGSLLKKEMEKKFNAGSLDYIRKLSVIQNSIFGVDIQPIAVEMARLRCFLSLIIEEKVDDKENNRGINPLPNLDFKFVIANTLIGLEKSQRTLFENHTHIEELKKIRDEYFNAAKEEQTELKMKFAEVQEKMLSMTNVKPNSTTSSMYHSLSNWKPFKNEHTEWFDPVWMFGESEFDIIIANPPYVESRSFNFSDELKDRLQLQISSLYGTKDASLVVRGADLLVYFFERSIKYSGKNGIITYITSNGWLNNEYGHKFQRFLLKHTNVLAVIDTDFKYFENANINTVITFFRGNTKTVDRVAFLRHHKKFADVDIGLNFENAIDTDQSVVWHSFDDDNLKWGVCFNADIKFFNLLEIMRRRGSSLATVGFTIGQGLNLINRDSYIVSKNDIKNLGISYEKCIPFMKNEESGYYSLDYVSSYLIPNNILSSAEKTEIIKKGYKLFNAGATSKTKPLMMMPRGIGGKHYCIKNNISSFSDSFVDIYSSFNKNSEDILRIWLFCNSSVCWFLRERFGRKNLGGGMLKAEAIDLKDKELFYKFDQMGAIRAIYDSLRGYKVKTCLNELEEPHHKKIDEIVFDFLEFDEDMRKFIIDSLKKDIEERTKKTKRKA